MATVVRQQHAQRYTEADIGTTELLPTYRVDLRPDGKDVFFDAPAINWDDVSWQQIGRPYRVERWSKEKQRWEKEHDQELPIKTSWEMFNRSFQHLFDEDALANRRAALGDLGKGLSHFNLHEAQEALQEIAQATFWNRAHRVQDAIWDPRGKRALFEGLDVKKPEILFLGAADGYEAMQLMAMYPGGHAVLVDYDDYCRTHRFGEFPAAYPFLGTNPASGTAKVWYRDQMAIDFEVADIRDLTYGPQFDVVVSIGLLEHFPDQYKPWALEQHRKFLKPGGYAILTTPRVQLQSKIFYTLFADVMNFSYRELMDVTHLGLYAHENGFEILRHGRIRAHNGIIAKVR
ncbi:MAG: methyltransferase domain-containing protein [Ktedonobacterales bacterium]|nr:methyltransferase domain-containing protein [Ktedonobacterales bacterium]